MLSPGHGEAHSIKGEPLALGMTRDVFFTYADGSLFPPQVARGLCISLLLLSHTWKAKHNL